ncbi:MAG: PD40 domain-containing protein [Bryobacterales bacterium]|nr:PD40 domain-containing protein [Bryobacterales bacterium]
MQLPELFLSFALAGVAAAGTGAPTPPLLMQKPTVNGTHIVFSFARDLWVVGRNGGDAARLTAGAGTETDPHFSPDGTKVAFTGEYDGNIDVFVVPVTGGVPTRLTYHPGPDTAAGWTPDGKSVLFRSSRDSHARFGRLFTVPLEGGLPTEVPLPMAEEGAYSPDGTRIAYVPLPKARTWKRYRGGRTTPIWIARLTGSSIEKLPRGNSNDFSPMWIGNSIYYLSDCNGAVTLFSYDLASRKIEELFPNTGLDIKSASAGPGAIALEQFGAILLYDLRTRTVRKVDIRIAADLTEVRPRFEKAGGQLGGGALSPNGARAVFEAHGEVITVPARRGNPRNLTNTPGAVERGPAWSPGGGRIAYFSDEPGEYELHIKDQNGLGSPARYTLAEPPAYYSSPLWSPDGKRIAYRGILSLYSLDLETGRSTLIGADTYHAPWRGLSPSWSPDSKWLAYSPLMKNHMRAVFVYSFEDGKAHRISDGLSDAQNPVFDRNGRHIYFTSSTNTGLITAWLDMSSIGREVTRNVYVVALRREDRSPLAPESDEEPVTRDKPPAEKKGDPAVRIDFDQIEQRILALPITARNYSYLAAGKEGILYLMEYPPAAEPWRRSNVHKFDMKARKPEKILDGVGAFEVSASGEQLLYVQNGKWAIASAASAPKPGEGALRLDDIEIRVDPRAEWRQMYREVWRIQRDMFYDPGLHGLDRERIQARYAPFLDGLTSRSDLTYLFQEMLGELTVGHLNVEGGSETQPKRVRGGLLGADFEIHNGRYRFKHVYSGENWNPQLRAPLTEPGVNVRAGDYLLAVNGRDLTATSNVYSFFEGTAGTAVLLRVASGDSGEGARDVTVVPIADEYELRNRAWIDGNRRKVDHLSGGRLAYVYLPSTGEAGFQSFNRYYYAQADKQGAIIDERFNRGGNMADYIVERLKQPLLNMWHTRAGEDFPTPQNQIFGPKVLIANEYSASGGDALAWMFRQTGAGAIVGKRTWGGMVGIFDIPVLMDGGFVTVPNIAFYNPRGGWELENVGVPPDIEVEQDPAAVRAGHDPQLEKAVEVALAALAAKPPVLYSRPAFPNYHRNANPRISDGGQQ